MPAAGLSRRMGRCKQLLTLGDRPVIVRCAETVISAGIRDIVVVTGGPQGDEIADAVRHLPVVIVRNEIPDSDMAASIRIGLAAVSRESDAVLVFVPDHPLVSTKTCKAIMELHLREPTSIIVPAFQGRKGHPPLFPRALLEELSDLPTLRHIMGKHGEKITLLETTDQGTVLDMDTMEDYRRVLYAFNGAPS
jgi:molybdenum cofactor cytidylyltransferase